MSALKWNHVFWLSHHIFAALYYQFFVDYTNITDDRILVIRNFHILYLTTWNFTGQLLFLAMSVAVDFLPKDHKYVPLLKKLKGYMFYSLVIPGTFVVATFFWIFFSINRELIYPSVCDEVFPVWLNHATHTSIAAVVLIEFILGKNILPSFRSAFIGLSLITITYDSLYLITFFSAGKWLYGIYYILNWGERLGFMVILYLMGVLALKCSLSFQNYKNSVKFNKILLKSN